MRTVGRRIRPGEKTRAMCERCNTLWDRRELRRDAEGMLVCPQEGSGRDGVTLTKGNAAAARAAAERLRRDRHPGGRYDTVSVTAIPGGHVFDDTFGEEFG